MIPLKKDSKYNKNNNKNNIKMPLKQSHTRRYMPHAKYISHISAFETAMKRFNAYFNVTYESDFNRVIGHYINCLFHFWKNTQKIRIKSVCVCIWAVVSSHAMYTHNYLTWTVKLSTFSHLWIKIERDREKKTVHYGIWKFKWHLSTEWGTKIQQTAYNNYNWSLNIL